MIEILDAELTGLWQPISTAPLNENLILSWYEDWPYPRWVIEVNFAGRDNKPGCGYLHSYATHWMPLPAPPVTEVTE